MCWSCSSSVPCLAQLGDATNTPVTQTVFILHVNRAELEEGKPCCVPASSCRGRASLQQPVVFYQHMGFFTRWRCLSLNFVLTEIRLRVEDGIYAGHAEDR